MKLIVAIVKPHHLESLRDAVLGHGADGLTVTEVRMRTHERTENLRGAPFSVDWLAVLRVEIAVKEEAVDAVVGAVIAHGCVPPGATVTRQPLEAVVRIRTEERGVLAL